MGNRPINAWDLLGLFEQTIEYSLGNVTVRQDGNDVTVEINRFDMATDTVDKISDIGVKMARKSGRKIAESFDDVGSDFYRNIGNLHEPGEMFSLIEQIKEGATRTQRFARGGKQLAKYMSDYMAVVAWYDWFTKTEQEKMKNMHEALHKCITLSERNNLAHLELAKQDFGDAANEYINAIPSMPGVGKGSIITRIIGFFVRTKVYTSE